MQLLWYTVYFFYFWCKLMGLYYFINLAPSDIYCLLGWYVIEISCWSNPDGDIESIHAGLLCCLYAQRVNTVFFLITGKSASVFVVVCNFDQLSSKTFWNLFFPLFCKYLLPTEEHPSVFFARLIHGALPPPLLKKHPDLSWNGFGGGGSLTVMCDCKETRGNIWIPKDLFCSLSHIFTPALPSHPPSTLAHFQF